MKIKSTNPKIKDLIDRLSKEEGNIWKDIAKRLLKPNRNRAEVNISRLNLHAKDGETIIIPGKVLGYGKMDKKINVAALSFSEEAKNKIEKSGGKCMDIEELIGSKDKMRIFG